MILNMFSLLDFYDPTIILKRFSKEKWFHKWLFIMKILKGISSELFKKLFSVKSKLFEYCSLPIFRTPKNCEFRKILRFSMTGLLLKIRTPQFSVIPKLLSVYKRSFLWKNVPQPWLLYMITYLYMRYIQTYT